MKIKSLLIMIGLLVLGCIIATADEKKRKKGAVIYKIKEDASAESLADLKKLLNSHGLKIKAKLKALNLNYTVSEQLKLTEEELSAVIIATGAVEFAEPDYLVMPVVLPNDINYTSQWHHTKINSPEAWDISTGNNSIIVGVCDSGVDVDHPDLAPNLKLPGFNSVDNTSTVDDVNGHGTKTAGVIGAVGNNSLGVAGVAWNIKILPVKISNTSDGYSYYSDMSEGIRWCADQGAKVVNLSYGGVQSSTVNSAAEYLRNKGGLLIMSAGNDGVNQTAFPDYPAFIAVGATTSSDTKASWSSYGTYVDVAAPGVGIWTTANGGGYSAPSGTSFAAPCTAGVVALIYSVNPNFKPDEVESFIFNSTIDLGTVGEDEVFGHGRINAAAALNAAANYSGNISPSAVVAASTTSGLAPLIIAFNGNGSTDSDGWISSYHWNFGDGSTATGKEVSHTFTTSDKTYNVVLTVTDNLGEASSDSIAIIVLPDPNVINAPSNLSGSASGNTVTINWSDNSNNEDGFYIERGVKSGKGSSITYSWSIVGSTGANIKTFSQTVNNGEYYYRVNAFNSNGVKSAYSNQIKVIVGSTKVGGRK